MFTGLIQTVGTLQALGSEHLQIACSDSTAALILKDLAIGDSVAVDGVCLTVTEILASGFVAVVSPETTERTTLSQSTGNKQVNLETSLRVGSKLGGHFVTGHIDGTGTLKSAVQTASSWEMTFTTTSDRVARYILPKGSVAVNGISLTVANCDPAGSWFTVAVIPHTYEETNLCHLNPGSWVNLEGDILGKYVEKFLRSGSPSLEEMASGSPAVFSPDFLAEHGYL
ncbi:MAG: riboflavin synthase [Phormidesmis sp. CAN_BIN36]|nr:riboflavin synthase [Phormidesmis sp. CAN_BIN36]